MPGGKRIPFTRRQEIKGQITNFLKMYPSKYFRMRRIKKWLIDEMKFDYNQKEIVTMLLELIEEDKLDYLARGNYWVYKYRKVVYN